MAKVPLLFLNLSAILLILSATQTSCRPNLSPQANDENLQSPPYLLEVLQQTPSSNNSASSNVSKNEFKSESKSETKRNTGSSDTLGPPKVAMGGQESASNLSVGGQVLENEPKLTTDSPAQNKTAPTAKQQDTGKEAPQELVTPSSVVTRKPQAQASSTHLKRPEFSTLIDPERQASEMASSMASETRAQLEEEDEAAAVASSALTRNSNGPKSRGPSGAAGDKGAEQQKSGGGGQQQPPDTLEPSQVMPVVGNPSLVPATVTRNYGTNTRTRITLGGGYVRNKLPPVVDPTASGHSDERNKKETLDRLPAETSSGQPEKSIHENSRLVEVPERVVLPTSVFSQAKKPPQQLEEETSNANDRLLLANVSSSLGDKKPQKALGKLDPRCPKSGTSSLEHPTACDKYYLCQNGHLSEQSCPNGLMYGERNTVKDYCVHRWEAVCEEKSVPSPISSPGCRWQWGIFGVQGSPKCTPDFYECRDGRFEVRKCAINGQVYDDRTKSCKFPEQVGCAEEMLAGFKCPPDDQANTYWPFPRYFFNERALIHCVNDKPAIIRCRDNERVDPEHLHCVQMKH